MVEAAAATTAVAIVIAAPPMTIRVILLAVGPGVAGVRTGPLEISPGVDFGLALAGVTLISILVAMALDIGRLSLPFPLRLL